MYKKTSMILVFKDIVLLGRNTQTKLKMLFHLIISSFPLQWFSVPLETISKTEKAAPYNFSM